MLVTRRVIFYGRVQGINFRSNTLSKAIELNVKGWVMNRIDGSVEGYFSGELRNVMDLIDYCVSDMPYAVVKRYDVYDLPYTEFPDFRIKR
ncbi:acylphosphatase [Thermoplasma sp.]|uniref:acylphosphatase n=1 Tax=Thermoplasma sp. TaxID=1973142 RepID=UPI00260E3B32|nr:acylphosphatase [Thermoplasma sp.]